MSERTEPVTAGKLPDGSGEALRAATSRTEPVFRATDFEYVPFDAKAAEAFLGKMESAGPVYVVVCIPPDQKGKFRADPDGFQYLEAAADTNIYVVGVGEDPARLTAVQAAAIHATGDPHEIQKVRTRVVSDDAKKVSTRPHCVEITGGDKTRFELWWLPAKHPFECEQVVERPENQPPTYVKGVHYSVRDALDPATDYYRYDDELTC